MFKIQEFSKKTGISKRMLRYLEDQGLLIPDRTDNDYRVYKMKHLEEIRWIQFWQRLGFSLIQIKTLKTLPPGKFEGPLEELLTKKTEELTKYAEQLSNIKQVIKKIRAQEPIDIQKDIETLESWTFTTREDFFSQVMDLTEDQILKHTRTIPNQEYLITVLLADPETRSKMFSVLTPDAKDLVTKDIAKLVKTLQDNWITC
jgi:MerR family copper efflux transcriptional regulator